VLFPHSLLPHDCSHYHQTTKNDQSRHNNRKHRIFITNLWTSSSPGGENSSQHTTIFTTKLPTHQTKQSESFQKTTIFTDVASSKQDLKNPQLIIISHGFYVETSWYQSNNLRHLITTPPPSSTKPSTKPSPMPSPMPSPKSTPLTSMNFHEKSINLKWKINFIQNQKVKVKNAQCMIFLL